MNINALGIDIAKNVFELHGVNANGKTILRKRLTRNKLVEFMAQLPSCLVGIEACGGAHHWGRTFSKMGHTVKLMNPQFVKPYVKSNKNDSNDAEAICEAVTRPNMRSVAIKSIEQQDIQATHRIRERLVQDRTALINQTRGLLGEYGIIIPQGASYVRRELPLILEDCENELSYLGRELLNDLLLRLNELDAKIAIYDKKIELICKNNEICQRLIQVEGVGALTATAMIASVGDARFFKNGREMAAFMGLVPKQYSSGGKQRLLGISKRGDRYLRCLLVHGARAALFRAKLPEKKAQWLKSLVERRGRNRAAVALANKNVRILWALMTKNEIYRKAA